MQIPKLPKPIKATLQVPGSKSYLNRALMCAALSEGTSILLNSNLCEDVFVMVKALRQLGVKIELKPKKLIVHGVGGHFKRPRNPIDIQNAGTAARFLLPHLPEGTILKGNEAMQKRPIRDLAQALEKIGYLFDCPTDHLPIKVLKTSEQGGEISMDSSVSSQFVSSLLMLAPRLRKGLKITIQKKPVSRPYIQMTIEVMEVFGLSVDHLKNGSLFISPQNYRGRNYNIPADASSAVYWWTLAAMTQSQIEVSNIDLSTQQADLKYLKILAEMGCQVRGTKVTGPEVLKPITADLRDFPDAALSLAVLATGAAGKTVIHGISHLKYKEVDRLTGLQENLRRIGVKIETGSDSITIYGGSPIEAAHIQTKNDHRFAMAFAILGLVTGKIQLDNTICVKKSYPDFFEDSNRILDEGKNQNLLITGMRGSGKSTVAKTLGQKFNCSTIDMDDEIEKKTQKSISELVSKKGWEGFRTIEHEVFVEIMKTKNQIISTGGGTLIETDNQPLIKGHYVWLVDTPITKIVERIKQDSKTDSQRPSLKGEGIFEELGQIYEERRPSYLRVADKIYNSMII